MKIGSHLERDIRDDLIEIQDVVMRDFAAIMMAYVVKYGAQDELGMLDN